MKKDKKEAKSGKINLSNKARKHDGLMVMSKDGRKVISHDKLCPQDPCICWEITSYRHHADLDKRREETKRKRKLAKKIMKQAGF